MFDHTDCEPSGLFLSARSVKLHALLTNDQFVNLSPPVYCLINFYDMATVFLSFRMFMTEQTDGPLADNGEVVRASLCSSNRASISTADLASATIRR